jgi:hypothetical protein
MRPELNLRSEARLYDARWLQLQPDGLWLVSTGLDTHAAGRWFDQLCSDNQRSMKAVILETPEWRPMQRWCSSLPQLKGVDGLLLCAPLDCGSVSRSGALLESLVPSMDTFCRLVFVEQPFAYPTMLTLLFI